MTDTLSFAPRWILHPTDFSAQSEIAFAHALAIALRTHGELTIIHVAPARATGKEWTEFPAVRGTLERWGMLEPGSPKSALPVKLGITVEKVDSTADAPLGAILQFVGAHSVDLMVLATHGRRGLPRWLHRSVAEPLARRARMMTLFVPPGAGGFVDRATGQISLRRLLIPVDRTPGPEAAIEIAAGLAGTMGGGPGELSLLHVGDESGMPRLDLPNVEGWSWTRTAREGKIVGEIVAFAEATKADAIVMATQGHEGVLDTLRGSTTEQVLRRAPCPVLAVPSS